MSTKQEEKQYKSKSNVVRVSKEVLDKLREIMPELRDDSDANLVRIALKKFIHYSEVGYLKLPSEILDESRLRYENALKQSGQKSGN